MWKSPRCMLCKTHMQGLVLPELVILTQRNVLRVNQVQPLLFFHFSFLVKNCHISWNCANRCFPLTYEQVKEVKVKIKCTPLRSYQSILAVHLRWPWNAMVWDWSYNKSQGNKSSLAIPLSCHCQTMGSVSGSEAGIYHVTTCRRFLYLGTPSVNHSINLDGCWQCSVITLFQIIMQNHHGWWKKLIIHWICDKICAAEVFGETGAVPIVWENVRSTWTSAENVVHVFLVCQRPQKALNATASFSGLLPVCTHLKMPLCWMLYVNITFLSVRNIIARQIALIFSTCSIHEVQCLGFWAHRPIIQGRLGQKALHKQWIKENPSVSTGTSFTECTYKVMLMGQPAPCSKTFKGPIDAVLSIVMA